MQLSRFILKYPDVRPGEHVLYDVIGDAYTGVDGTILEAIDRWKSAPPGRAQEEEWASTLSDLGILVRDREADEERLRASLERSAEGMAGTLYVTLIPTMACNLACTYCFQKNHPSSEQMSPSTEEAAVAWILKRADEARSRKLVVCYMGGEPLTRRDFLLRTAAAFSCGMSERGGLFEWELITNGIGLDAAFAHELRKFGHGSVKVTLDGDKHTHDIGRVYRSGRGTFDEVFAALIDVAKNCPDVAIRVGGNFRPGEEASYERLLDKLENAGMAGRIEQMHFKPIIDTDDGLASCAGACGTGKSEAETLVRIDRSLARRKLETDPIEAIDAVGLCSVHWKRSFAIDPMGRIYKCAAVAGRPELAIGSVEEAGEERPDPLTAARPWRADACQACAFLPVCMGGCLGGRYLQVGKTGEVLCPIEQLERVFRRDVVARYLAEFGEPQEEREVA